jgi:hypothetical protein
MKKIFTWLVLTVAPVLMQAQATTGYHRVGQVLARGNSGTQAVIQPYASVAVTATASGLAATIYSDPLLTALISPSVVTANASGNYDYYIPLGYCVTETITYAGSGGITIPNICVVSGSTTGVVNSGTSGQLAYYRDNGNVLSGETFATLSQGGTGATSAAGAWSAISPGVGAQAANTFWGGPATGSDALPAFRSLVSADIPNNAANTSGNATTATTATLATTASALASTPVQCGAGQFSTGIAANGNANCGSPTSSGIIQLSGDATAGPGSGNQALTFATVNSGPGVCGDATHVCQVTTNGKGLVTGQASVAVTFPSSPIIARITFTSCTVADDGNAGEGCEATQSWGTTLPATYYMWCQVGTWSGGGTIGNRGGFAINISSQSTTDFSYNIDSRQDAGRGIAALATTCWATL